LKYANKMKFITSITNKTLALNLFILIYSPLFSQTKPNQIYFRFQPLPALNIGIPRIQGGIEYIYNNKIGVEIGYGKRYLDNNYWIHEQIDTIMINPHGTIKIIDLNFYNIAFKKLIFKKENRKLDTFLGVSFRQIHDEKNKQRVYYNNDDTDEFQGTHDCYIIQKNINVYALKLGIDYSLKRFVITGNTEFGIRYRNQKLINSEFNIHEDSFPDGIFFWEKEHHGYTPHLNLMIKLGYKII